jgi:folate-binding protein YgfZ
MLPSTQTKIEPVDYVSRLADKGIIQLQGEERVKYLQGQVTADINQLSDNNVLLACHCDFKGKTWSVFYAVNWQDSILLITHSSVLDTSLAELNKYGVFAKVEISDQTKNWQLIGGAGGTFEQSIIEVFGELPKGNKNKICTANGIVLSIEQPNQRYLVLQPLDAVSLLNYDIDQEDNHWEVDDIQAGFADIRQSTSHEYVPQMLNLQVLGAIDFEKGCYMGQEVVARTKYLGRNKRAGFILKAESSYADLTGELLEYQIGENWRPGGKILRSGVQAQQTWIFAVLANDTQVDSTFRIKSAPDKLFVIQALPYNLQ